MKRFVKLIGFKTNDEVYIRADKITSIGNNGGNKVSVFVIGEELPWVVMGNSNEIVRLVDEALQ